MYVGLFICSPGVIKTEIHKRGGQTDEQYEKVNIVFYMIRFMR